MNWTALPFSKHRGLSLPQALFTEPGWFFWAFRLPLRESLGYEASLLYPRATRIRVPQEAGDQTAVEYVLDTRAGGLAAVQLVPEAVGGDGGGSRSFTKPYIDLSIPSQLAPFDKTGGRIIVDFLKVSYFGSTGHKMTRERCERFFDTSHFRG